jgi:hypothetical protein
VGERTHREHDVRRDVAVLERQAGAVVSRLAVAGGFLREFGFADFDDAVLHGGGGDSPGKLRFVIDFPYLRQAISRTPCQTSTYSAPPG